jgi:hypothetical protein
MQKYFNSVSSSTTGLPVFRAQITVTDSNGIPVQLYSDDGMTTISQPIRTDIFGFFSFFVPDGVYTITTADPDGNNPRSVQNVAIFDDSDTLGAISAAITAALNTLVYPKLPISITNYPIFQYNPNDLRDMGSVIQTALNAGVRDFSGVNLYINSAVVIPNNVTITWAPQGEIIPKGEGYFNRTGIWVLGPNAAINWGRTTVLMNPAIVHRDFMAPPVITGNATTDTAAAKSRLDARTSNGTAMLLNRPDVLVFNPLIVGFNKGIIINAERVRVLESRIDCTNAIEGYGISDVCYVNDAHIWPYWAAHNATITLAITASYNTGLYFHDQADGVQINGGLIYGMAISERYSNVYSLKAKGVWIDGDADTNAARGSIGILTEGVCQFLDISHSHVDSQAYSRKLTHTGGTVLWSDSTSSNAQVADTILGSGHSTGSVAIQSAKGSALLTFLENPGFHDVRVRSEGGTATNVIDRSAVINGMLTGRTTIRYTRISGTTIDNVAASGVVPADFAYFAQAIDRANSTVPLMEFVTDPTVADWKPYFDAAVGKVDAVAFEGAIVTLPADIQIPLSYVDPIHTHGVVFQGPGRIAWPDAGAHDNSAGIRCLASSNDVFSWGTGVQYDVRGGGLRGVSILAGAKTGGRIVAADVVMGLELEELWIRDPFSGFYILGGIDPLIDNVHIEGFRASGAIFEGTLAKRGDRARIENFRLAGVGNESGPTSTGDALSVIGNWHTVDANVVTLVKCGNYGYLQKSDLIAQQSDARPSFVTIQNLQTDYTRDNSIFCRDGRDFKLSDVYANTSLQGDTMTFGAGMLEVMVSRARVCGAKNRLITVAGSRSVKFDTVHGWNWNAQGGNGAAVGVGGAFSDFSLKNSSIGVVADQSTPNTGPGVIVDSGTNGAVRVAGNLFTACGNAAQAAQNGSTGPSNNFAAENLFA